MTSEGGSKFFPKRNGVEVEKQFWESETFSRRIFFSEKMTQDFSDEKKRLNDLVGGMCHDPVLPRNCQG